MSLPVASLQRFTRAPATLAARMSVMKMASFALSIGLPSETLSGASM